MRPSCFTPDCRGQRIGYPRRARKRGQARKGHTFQEDGVQAVVYKGPFTVAVEEVPDARIEAPERRVSADHHHQHLRL